MSKTEKERLNTLKVIAENPSITTSSEQINGYVAADLVSKGLITGLKSHELGRGPEPIFIKLNITIDGKKLLEENNLVSRIKKVLLNPYTVGIVVAIIGVAVAAWFVWLAK